jgi:hypothetical protein
MREIPYALKQLVGNGHETLARRLTIDQLHRLGRVFDNPSSWGNVEGEEQLNGEFSAAEADAVICISNRLAKHGMEPTLPLSRSFLPGRASGEFANLMKELKESRSSIFQAVAETTKWWKKYWVNDVIIDNIIKRFKSVSFDGRASSILPMREFPPLSASADTPTKWCRSDWCSKWAQAVPKAGF